MCKAESSLIDSVSSRFYPFFCPNGSSAVYTFSLLTIFVCAHVVVDCLRVLGALKSNSHSRVLTALVLWCIPSWTRIHPDSYRCIFS